MPGSWKCSFSNALLDHDTERNTSPYLVMHSEVNRAEPLFFFNLSDLSFKKLYHTPTPATLPPEYRNELMFLLLRILDVGFYKAKVCCIWLC